MVDTMFKQTQLSSKLSDKRKLQLAPHFNVEMLKKSPLLCKSAQTHLGILPQDHNTQVERLPDPLRHKAHLQLSTVHISNETCSRDSEICFKLQIFQMKPVYIHTYKYKYIYIICKICTSMYIYI